LNYSQLLDHGVHMILDVTNRVAIVTGGARGIGRACVLKLAQAGADIVIADIDLDAGKAYGGELTADSVQAEVEALGRNAIGIEGDLSDRSAAKRVVDDAIARFGKIDILVNAMGGAISPMETSYASITTEEDQATLFKANYISVVNMCQEAIPYMRGGAGRSIVNISSGAGSYTQPNGMLAHYAASKAALVSYTRALAAELGRDNIRANCVAAGATLTLRVAATAKARNMVTEETGKAIPLGRLGHADDIANVVVFLASDLGGWLTGQNIGANGGEQIGPF
jgi:3-oxoacyl-[acyl-carrier protein] reductase